MFTHFIYLFSCKYLLLFYPETTARKKNPICTVRCNLNDKNEESLICKKKKKKNQVFGCCDNKCLYPFRHHYEDLLAAEENNDDVDTVKYAKKRRIEENNFEGSSQHKRKGGSLTHMLRNLSIVFSVNSSLFQSLISDEQQVSSCSLYSSFTVFILTRNRRQWLEGVVWWCGVCHTITPLTLKTRVRQHYVGLNVSVTQTVNIAAKYPPTFSTLVTKKVWSVGIS